MAKEPKRVPDCWVCRKPCDSLARIGALGGAEHYEFVAYCHGEQDRVRVPLAMMKADGSPRVEFGYAFQPPNLLAEEEPGPIALAAQAAEGRR